VPCGGGSEDDTVRVQALFFRLLRNVWIEEAKGNPGCPLPLQNDCQVKRTYKLMLSQIDQYLNSRKDVSTQISYVLLPLLEISSIGYLTSDGALET
jgi:hypothetical protein